MIENIIQSPRDSNQYRFLCLENGLKVVLVHDSMADIAAVSLCVTVGSFQDPEPLPGLAHLAEHMVLLGSQEYPDPSAFHLVCQDHDFINGCTFPEHTIFNYTVSNSVLFNSFGIFSSYFVSPLISSEMIELEIEAIDKEFYLSAAKDSSRVMYTLESTAMPLHPLRKFKTGNKESLLIRPREQNIDVREYVMNFCKEFYVAQMMTLSVYSSHSLDDLEKAVRQMFARIPSTQRIKPSYEFYGPPLSRNFLQIFKVQSIKEGRNLFINWVTPPEYDNFDSKPLLLLEYLFKYKGNGGLIHHLQEKFWILKAKANSGLAYVFRNSTMKVFNFKLKLTEEGFNHIAEIIILIQTYIEMLKKYDMRPYFEYVKKLSNREFCYDRPSPQELTEIIAFNLSQYDPKYCLCADHYLSEHDSEQFSNLLQHFKWPFNITVTSSYFSLEELNLREPRTNTPYAIYDSNYLNDLLASGNQFQNLFFLPPPANVEYPVAMYDRTTKSPTMILQDDISQIWHTLNDLKGINAMVNYQFSNIFFNYTAKSLLHLEIYSFWLKFKSVSIDLSATIKRGRDLVISMVGTMEDLENFCSNWLYKFPQPFINNEDLIMIKQQLLAKYSKQVKNGYQLMDEIIECFDRPWTLSDRMEELFNVECIDLFYSLCAFFTNSRIKALYSGNIDINGALRIHNSIAKRVLFPSVNPYPSAPRFFNMPRIVQVSSPNSDDLNSYVLNIYRCGEDTFENICRTRLLVNKMTEALFDSMRTKQQLAYSLSCQTHKINGWVGFEVCLTSPSHQFSCLHITVKIQEFLIAFLEGIIKQSKESFEKQKESYRENYLNKRKNCEEIWWNEIVDGGYLFNRKEHEDIYLKSLHKSEYDSWIREINLNILLSIQIAGKCDKNSQIFPHCLNSKPHNLIFRYSPPLPMLLFVKNTNELQKIKCHKSIRKMARLSDPFMMVKILRVKRRRSDDSGLENESKKRSVEILKNISPQMHRTIRKRITKIRRGRLRNV